MEGIYEGQPIVPWNPAGDEMQEVPPFSLEELQLQQAVDKGKLGKALGPDGVPHELLVQVAYRESAGPQLLEWYNGILRTSILPYDWSSIVMVMLPKISQPVLAKQLRPISLGSAVRKVFSRMLLNRSLPLIGEAGSKAMRWTRTPGVRLPVHSHKANGARTRVAVWLGVSKIGPLKGLRSRLPRQVVCNDSTTPWMLCTYALLVGAASRNDSQPSNHLGQVKLRREEGDKTGGGRVPLALRSAR